MNMKEAQFLYKCRRCGEIDRSLGCGVKLAPRIFHECVTKGKTSTGGMIVSMVDSHICKTDHYGVTDLIGYEIVGEDDETN